MSVATQIACERTFLGVRIRAAIERLGGKVVKVPFDRWWQVLQEHEYPGLDGLFIHPVSDRAVMAGNGTVALEIAEDLPDFDAVLVPFGGGGLSCGIASALEALRPGVPVWGCEVATAAPLAASFAAGSAQPADYATSHQLGAVVCMAKPFKPERLQQVVRLVAPPPALKGSGTRPSRTGVGDRPAEGTGRAESAGHPHRGGVRRPEGEAAQLLTA